MKISVLIISILFCINAQAQTVTDVDGNVYNTVTIGSQTWMKENLKTVRYQNGDSIGTTFPATKNITIESNPKYQWAYDGIESKADTFGRLYTWHTATDSRKVCPVNWHIPSDQEWDTLISFLGGVNTAGNTMATNNFSAKYAGRRHLNGTFVGITGASHFWSADSTYMNSYWKPSINSVNSSAESFGNLFRSRSLGFSIRCMYSGTTLGIIKVKLNQNYITVDNRNNTISITSKGIDNPVLFIYNTQGKLMLTKNIKGDNSQINIDHLPSGVYISQLKAGNFAFEKKWVKIN